jgi:ribosomal protein L33
MDRKTALTCQKCSGRMFVDRAYSSAEHLEIFCMVCGKREIFDNISRFGDRVKWIMQMEKIRAKRSGNSI